MRKEAIVGAEIIRTLTESLYDKPEVVFREYVQNAADSFQKLFEKRNSKDIEHCRCDIWNQDVQGKKSLFFLDNGVGIPKDEFQNKMLNIGQSDKIRSKNIGYKGIGRLSGMSYCHRLYFINFLDVKENEYQCYVINVDEYDKLKNDDEIISMEYKEFMQRIGSFENDFEMEIKEVINDRIFSENSMFNKCNTGFLVIMYDLKKQIQDKLIDANSQKLMETLGWMLPVGFKDNVFHKAGSSNTSFVNVYERIFKVEPSCLQEYSVFFNNLKIERPVGAEHFRKYQVYKDFGDAVGFLSFNADKLVVSKDKVFVGIKIYCDNFLLCDETELIDVLYQNGYTNHTINELIQTTRTIGMMIFIKNKINLAVNARRTFVEINNEETLEFMDKMAQFLEDLYDARYSLSKYQSFVASEKDRNKQFDSKRQQLLDKANAALQKIAEDEVVVEEGSSEIKNLTEIEKKRVLKQILVKLCRKDIDKYINVQETICDCGKEDEKVLYGNFIKWLKGENQDILKKKL